MSYRCCLRCAEAPSHCHSSRIRFGWISQRETRGLRRASPVTATRTRSGPRFPSPLLHISFAQQIEAIPVGLHECRDKGRCQSQPLRYLPAAAANDGALIPVLCSLLPGSCLLAVARGSASGRHIRRVLGGLCSVFGRWSPTACVSASNCTRSPFPVFISRAGHDATLCMHVYVSVQGDDAACSVFR